MSQGMINKATKLAQTAYEGGNMTAMQRQQHLDRLAANALANCALAEAINRLTDAIAAKSK